MALTSTSIATDDTTITALLMDGTFLGQVTVTVPNDGASRTYSVPFNQAQTDGTRIQLILGANGTTYETTCSRAFIPDPFGDVDGDGVVNSQDNCVSLLNPGQEDGWGSALGDACDNSLYDSQTGVKAFQQKDNSFNIFGNCRPVGNRTECAFIANFNPANLSQSPGPQRFQSDESEGWYVEVYYLGQENGQAVYQVNVYDATGTLQDDNLEILLVADGAVSWRKQI
jgi:hypothetical protein